MVEHQLDAQYLHEIGAHRRVVDGGDRLVGDAVAMVSDARVDEHQPVAGLHRVTDGDVDSCDDARLDRGDDVLHLHRLEHQELLACSDDRPASTLIATTVPCIGGAIVVIRALRASNRRPRRRSAGDDRRSGPSHARSA